MRFCPSVTPVAPPTKVPLPFCAIRWKFLKMGDLRNGTLDGKRCTWIIDVFPCESSHSQSLTNPSDTLGKVGSRGANTLSQVGSDVPHTKSSKKTGGECEAVKIMETGCPAVIAHCIIVRPIKRVVRSS